MDDVAGVVELVAACQYHGDFFDNSFDTSDFTAAMTFARHVAGVAHPQAKPNKKVSIAYSPS